MPRRYTYTGPNKELREQTNRTEVKRYRPRGDRATWSKAQYTIYKEEQRYGREEQWAERKPILDAIVKEVDEASSKKQWLKEGRGRRSILAEVAGRKNGQPGVRKDKKGLPLVDDAEGSESEVTEEDDSSSDDVEIDDGGKRKAKAGSSMARTRPSRSDGKLPTVKSAQQLSRRSGDQSKLRAPKRAHLSESEEEEEITTHDKKCGKGKSNNNKSTKRQKKASQEEWVVPDSSDESENELIYLRDQGLEIIHDHWPSTWRVKAAEKVHNERIDKDVRVSSIEIS